MLIDPRVADDRTRANEALTLLGEALAQGGWLTPLESGDLPLHDGESVYAQLPMHVHCLSNVRHARTRPAAIAGTGAGWWISAGVAWMSRRQRRTCADVDGVRWVDAGVRLVFLTDRRALFLHQGRWSSCWPRPGAWGRVWTDEAGRTFQFSGAWLRCAGVIRRWQMARRCPL